MFLTMNNNFEKFVRTWKTETKDLKLRNEYSHLLFLVVCPDNIEWSFSVEKQCQTTTLMVSGGPTGAGTGHDVQFCYRSEVNDFLKECMHTHAMIVSIGMVFDMVECTDDISAKWRNNFVEARKRKIQLNQLTPITDFYDFVENGEYIKGHILAKKDQPAYLHHQHINLNVDMWKTLGCPPLDERWNDYERSNNNYHDDYTPFWLTPKGWLKIKNFTHDERRRKSFSYYRDYDDAWNNLSKVWDYVEKDDFYFTRFMTRIQESFYIFNTESLKKMPEGKFDLLFSPTAGYSAEACVDKLDFDGEVVLYDYVQQNIDLKRTIVEMNMSIEELHVFRNTTNKNLVYNTTNYPATQRIVSMGTHEELMLMQARMRDEQEIEYWLMDIISPDYNRLLKKLKGRNVYFDASNIFSYHMSHANYTLDELISSYNKLKEILTQANKCWFQGTKPTKQWEITWI